MTSVTKFPLKQLKTTKKASLITLKYPNSCKPLIFLSLKIPTACKNYRKMMQLVCRLWNHKHIKSLQGEEKIDLSSKEVVKQQAAKNQSQL